MKLNEIKSELIDQMLDEHPIRGILTSKKMKSYNINEFCFHWMGWHYFDSKTLKPTEKHSNQDFIEIQTTQKGILYFFTDKNTLCFLRKKSRTHNFFERVVISMDFSDDPIINNWTGFLLSKGVECYIRKFKIPYSEKGEMMIGHWEDTYISAI